MKQRESAKLKESVKNVREPEQRGHHQSYYRVRLLDILATDRLDLNLA